MTTPYGSSSLYENWLHCVPEDYQHATFDNCTELPKGLVDFGRSWSSKFPLTSLYLYGDWGCGKTFFSFAAIRQVMHNLKGKGYFWPNYKTGEHLERDLLKAIKAEDGDAYMLETWIKSDLLLIDDLDKAQTSERFKKQMFSIINGRTLEKRPTIITSNCRPDEMANILDGSIVSRMNDRTKWTIIEFPKGDLRKKKMHIQTF